MFKHSVTLFLLFILASPSYSGGADAELWPEIDPYQKDFLRVSKIHQIYYELCGNPEGKPVFVLHGGPGGSCSPYMRRFFNPQKFLIVLHDQRGAGRSKPYAETRDNTTQHLISDIEQLRVHLGLGKVIIFGGSWGSTLGIAYAEAYPENVSGMILRGIFTAASEEIDHFYHGGVRKFFPETYDRLISSIPGACGDSVPKRLLKLIENGNPEDRKKYCEIWAEYEIKISSLNVPDENVESIVKTFNPIAFGLLENYYMANGCFLEEGQLLDNAQSIEDIPTVLINGRYDMICPPLSAYRLHKKLNQSKLIIVESSGHWMGESAVEEALLKAVSDFE